MERKEKMAGVTFTGSVTFNGPMFDIHDNGHVYIGKPERVEDNEEAKDKRQEARGEGEELFHFIHPSVDSQQEWQIHDEVKRLVARQGIQEICQHLLKMRSEDKVLLPQSVKMAYVELIRMGMPSGEGYSEKTFQKYYKN